MKALEKDRNRRYETANGFAADVQRYLCGEAVQAVPPSVGYRLRKFARRNRGPVVAGSAAAAMVVLAVVGLVVGTLLFQREQTRAANDRAELKAEANRQLEAQLYRQRIALAEREWYANNLSRMEDLLDAVPARSARLGMALPQGVAVQHPFPPAAPERGPQRRVQPRRQAPGHGHSGGRCPNLAGTYRHCTQGV